MFTLPDLPFDYRDLEPFIDEETMHIHHDKHHAAYVTNLNKALEGHDDLLSRDIEDLLAHLDLVPESARTAVRNNGGGHANHSHFWRTLSKPGQAEPDGKLRADIDATFGSFQKFQETFGAAAMTRFGSGWAWLAFKSGKLDIHSSANQDSPLMEGMQPLLGLDVWEHAYYLHYQNRRQEYVNAWWNVVNWKEVEKIYDQSH